MFGQSGDSADVAKQRLQLMLASDRTDISPETLEVLKDEIIAAISKHVAIDRENVQVSVTRTPQGSRLVANIPVVPTRAPRNRLALAGGACGAQVAVGARHGVGTTA
jgi:cell division topological specificity factor